VAHVFINFAMKWTYCGQPLFIAAAKAGAKD